MGVGWHGFKDAPYCGLGVLPGARHSLTIGGWGHYINVFDVATCAMASVEQCTRGF